MDEQLRKSLVEQAKKCQTISGATMLLSIANGPVFSGMAELWQVADHLASQKMDVLLSDEFMEKFAAAFANTKIPQDVLIERGEWIADEIQ